MRVHCLCIWGFQTKKHFNLEEVHANIYKKGLVTIDLHRSPQLTTKNRSECVRLGEGGACSTAQGSMKVLPPNNPRSQNPDGNETQQRRDVPQRDALQMKHRPAEASRRRSTTRYCDVMMILLTNTVMMMITLLSFLVFLC